MCVCVCVCIQQNSFNMTFNNSELLTIWYVRGLIPRREVLLFTVRNLQQWNRQMSRTCLKGLQGCLYINCCCTSWPHVSYSINIFSCEDSRRHNRGLTRPWTSSWRRYPNGILLWLVLRPKYRISKKKIMCKNLVHYKYCLIIWNIW